MSSAEEIRITYYIMSSAEELHITSCPPWRNYTLHHVVHRGNQDYTLHHVVCFLVMITESIVSLASCIKYHRHLSRKLHVNTADFLAAISVAIFTFVLWVSVAKEFLQKYKHIGGVSRVL